ncbi:phage minor capsid protein [Actinokineospora enzanensis]|uniref:phage minor capsid protein n=1 Tax=Actinokineospora enzanensis TaxID=155975 RepID=UPI001FE01DCA|nr:phage minor capsid protein [Actinokineospora enzanensis]
MLKLLLDVWDQAAERMLATVVKHLVRGHTAPDWATAKTRETLALRAELRAVVAQADALTPELVTLALDEAYAIGARAATTLDVPAVVSRPQAVQQLATRLVTRLEGAHVPVIAAHERMAWRVVSDVELGVQAGAGTRQDAIAEAVDKLLVRGEDRFVDKSGRRWHLDAYARMAGRTISGQTAVQGQLDTMVAEGRDLVVVSDSPRECGVCRPWEGNLLSITGRTATGTAVDRLTVAGTVAEAVTAGLQHPNCTHRLDPHAVGFTRAPRPAENPTGYREQQTLRRLEREMRDLRRRQSAAEQIDHNGPVARRLRAQIRAKSTRIREHTEATGQIRRRDREQPAG